MELFSTIAFILYCLVQGGEGTGNVTTLVNHLFANYHNDIIPNCGGSSANQVKIGMAVRQIVDLNEPKQQLQINAWIRLRWTDCHLTWNKTEYGGIDHIIVPFDKVWVPDLTLYDNVGSTMGGFKDYRPTIYDDGSMAYNFPSIITSLCKVDVTYFPFDTQRCALTFGSWAYHGFELNVSKLAESGDLTSFVASVEWFVTEVPAVRHELIYGCCPEPYPDVTFYVVLNRKPLFYLMNLMFPCMLITTVACLGFLLPPDSGEKVSLEITVLLSLAVFLLVVSETLPPSSETFPYIGVYFACAMLLVSMSCLMTVIVLNLHFKGIHGKEMSPLVKRIFLDVLGRFVLMKQHRSATVAPLKVQGNEALVITSYENDIFDFETNGLDNRSLNTKPITRKKSTNEDNQENAKVKNSDQSTLDSLLEASDFMKILRKQLECLKAMDRYIKEKNHRDNSMSEWQLLAQVLDRLFLIVFIIVSITSTMGIILRSSGN